MLVECFSSKPRAAQEAALHSALLINYSTNWNEPYDGSQTYSRHTEIPTHPGVWVSASRERDLG